jgi:hypothetical protein
LILSCAFGFTISSALLPNSWVSRLRPILSLGFVLESSFLLLFRGFMRFGLGRTIPIVRLGPYEF